MEERSIRPDDVCAAFAEKKGHGRIALAVDDKNAMVVIEGDTDTLEMIGNLFLAQARYKTDCEFSIGPRTAGVALFDKRKSTHGLYIHRLPCLEETGTGRGSIAATVLARMKPRREHRSIT